MAKCGIVNINGGGGIGSDELSVTADKVVEGNTYVGADTNDEIRTGTLIDRPSTVSAQSVAQGLSGGSNYIFTRIPTGAYRTPTGVGYPEITALSSSVATAGGLTADKVLAGKSAFGFNGTATSDANALAPDILVNKSAYVNGAKVPGSMPDYSKTPTPIDAIRMNNNRFEVAVARGFHGYDWAGNGYEYMSYDQVANAIGLTPARIKKGEWILGRQGTFEGWVPTANDLYVRGNNIGGFSHGSGSGTATYQSGGIQLSGSGAFLNETSTSTFDLSPYNYLNIEGYFERRDVHTGGEQNVSFTLEIRDGSTIIAQANNAVPTAYNNFTTSVYIGPIALSKRITLRLGFNGQYWYDGNDGRYWITFAMGYWWGWIYRIWLS